MNKNVRNIVLLNLASILRNLYGLLRAKITAVLLTLEAVGTLGQIVTFFSIQSKITPSGSDAVLVNQLGKIKDHADSKSLSELITYGFSVIVFVNTIYIIFFLLTFDQMTTLIFDDINYIHLFKLLVFLGPFHAISFFFEVLSQARQRYGELVTGQNIRSITAIASVGPFIYYYGVFGIVYSLYAFVLSGGLYFFIINGSYLRYLNPRLLFQNQKIFFEFAKIGFSALARRIIVFVSLMMFRIIIVQLLGLAENGLFQSIWSISLYADIFIGAFITFYFPEISKVQSKEDVKNTININIGHLIYLLFPIIAFIMLFPDLLLFLLFKSDFMGVASYLRLIVYFKYIEVFYNFFLITFLAQSKLKAFMACELLRHGILVIGSYFLILQFGFFGAILGIMLMQTVSILLVWYFISGKGEFELTKINVKLVITTVLLLALLLFPLSGVTIIRVIQTITFLVLAVYLLDLGKFKHLLDIFIKHK